MSEPFANNGPTTGPVAQTATATDARVVSAPSMSAFLPVLILGLVLLAWFGFQASQLHGERDAVREVMAGQEKTMQDSKKLRDSLDAIARGTAQLADGGNQNARLIVDELKKRGITISPNQPTGLDPAAPAPPK